HLDSLEKLAAQLKWNHKETLETLQTHRFNLNQSIRKMENSKRAFQAHSVLKDLEESFKQWENALKTYFSLKKDRIALYEGDDINEKSNDSSSKITHSIANISSLENQLTENGTKLKTTSADKTKKEEQLENILLNEQLEDIKILRTSILSEERARKIREQENKLNEQKTRISEKENLLEKVLKELKEKDDAEISLETLTTLFEESKKQWDELSVNIGKITQSLED